jgi:hypothetical protein
LPPPKIGEFTRRCHESTDEWSATCANNPPRIERPITTNPSGPIAETALNEPDWQRCHTRAIFGS